MTFGVERYSTTASNNINANTGIVWDEGMSPALVNNSARQNMADTRARQNDLIWFQYGTGDTSVLSTKVVYNSSTSILVKGVDVTAVYHAGRRVKAVASTPGTIYGTIKSSSFSTDTTVNITWDSGSLSNETVAIYLSQIPVTGNPVPTGGTERNAYYSAAGFTRVQTSGAPQACGFGSSWALTPKSTGRLKILVTGWTIADSSSTIISFAPYYGTGTAPVAGGSGGTAAGPELRNAGNATSSTGYAFSYYAEVTGLTLGTAYWFDMEATNGLSGAGTMNVATVLIEEF